MINLLERAVGAKINYKRAAKGSLMSSKMASYHAILTFRNKLLNFFHVLNLIQIDRFKLGLHFSSIDLFLEAYCENGVLTFS